MNHITSEVVEWCRTQQYHFFYSDLWLLFVALVFVVAAVVSREFKWDLEGVEKSVATVGFLYGAVVLIVAFVYINL